MASFGKVSLVAAIVMIPAVLLVIPSAEAATSRTLTINQTSAKPLQSFASFDGNPAKVFDFNGDGKLEIIAQNDNQWVYVFDSQTGAILAEFKTKFPTNWGARSFNGPEAAVVQDGQLPRIIVANSAATITSYVFEPTTSSLTKFTFIKLWERRLTECYSGPGMDSKPVLADLDKDGKLEILAGTEEKGLYALRADGSLYWKNCLGGGNAEPTVADLNLDGWPDVVHVSDGGNVAALNGRTGGWMWNFYIKSKFDLSSGSIPVGAGVGQLDGKAGPDVVVGARDSHDAENWDNDHAALVAIDSAGKLLWGKQDPMGNPLTYTHPIIVDAANDGSPEVYWGDWNTIGHKPPADESQAWKPTGPANFYRYDQFGNMVWRQTIGTFWSNKDLALADVDADGVQEVLVNGPNTSGADGIWYLDSRNGAKEVHVSTAPYKVSRGPIVADLWDTGTMQWVVETGPAIQVFDTHVAYNSKWPHLPYVSKTGGGDPPPPPTTTPPTTPTTPPPPGSFSATYEVPSSVNNWWVEVKVTGTQSVASVDARVNSGSWIALQHQSWGNWAKSFFVATGSTVEFRATSTSGEQHVSAPMQWLGPSGPFSATFEPKSQTNNWWVQVKVTSPSNVAAVHSQVNGGSWTALDRQSWGDWAKSFFVADGATVTFRATGSGGDTVTSAGYVWG